MKEIPLTQCKIALVDDEDFAWLSQYRWFAHRCGNPYYVGRQIRREDGSWTLQRMHRLIMNAQPGQEIDHINGNGLDNRRSNLRFTTRSQNGANGHMNRGGTSKYKGVSWHKNCHKWEVCIQKNGQIRHLGLFVNEKEAALVYDQIARELFGEFAKTNF